MKLEKSDIKYILLVIGIALLAFLLVKKIPKTLIFIGLTLLTGIIVFGNYLLKIPIDFSPVFFLSLVITSALGFGYTLLFVILAGFVPSLFSGSFNPSSFVYLVVNLLVNLVSISFELNFLVESVMLAFVYGFIVSVINGSMESSFGQEIFVNLVGFGVNVVYFWKLGEILVSIL